MGKNIHSTLPRIKEIQESYQRVKCFLCNNLDIRSFVFGKVHKSPAGTLITAAAVCLCNTGQSSASCKLITQPNVGFCAYSAVFCAILPSEELLMMGIWRGMYSKQLIVRKNSVGSGAANRSAVNTLQTFGSTNLITGWVWSKAGGTADPEICFGFRRCPGVEDISHIKIRCCVKTKTSIEIETCAATWCVKKMYYIYMCEPDGKTWIINHTIFW